MRWRAGLFVAGALSAAACGLVACGGGSSAAIDSGLQINYTAALAAVERLNEYRNQANCPPVTLDTDLSLGCQAHAQYLTLNDISLRVVGLGAHDESAALPGFSLAGSKAAENSIIYEGVTSVEAIDNWMCTFYHRLGLLDPNLKTVGFGSAADYQVMDVRNGMAVGSEMCAATVLFPAAGMTAAPRNYKSEIPHPIPGDSSLGVPITVEFSGPNGWDIREVLYEVLDVDTGRIVPCYLQTPGRPFLFEWDIQGLIALIPQDPLPAQHTFRVYVRARVDQTAWAAEWFFATR